jgi:hypothetical protein
MERVMGLQVCAESCGSTGVEIEAPSPRRVVVGDSGRTLGKGD